MGGQIRRGRIWRCWGAPVFSPEVPKYLFLKGFGTSGRKIGAPQKRQIQPRRIWPPKFGNGPNTVSGSMGSNTELSEFFGPHRVPGRELSEFLSAYYLCAKANSPSLPQNSPSLPQNSVSSLSRNSTLETVFRPFPTNGMCGPLTPCSLSESSLFHGFLRHRTLISWHIWRAYVLLIWGVGAVELVFIARAPWVPISGKGRPLMHEYHPSS